MAELIQEITTDPSGEIEGTMVKGATKVQHFVADFEPGNTRQKFLFRYQLAVLFRHLARELEK